MPAETIFGLTRFELAAVRMGNKRVTVGLEILEFVASKPEGATCDECMEALDLSHQSGSARYHELVQVGCLVSTGKKKPTRSGATASLHKVAPDANFAAYLVLTRTTRKKKLPGLSEIEQEVLNGGLEFIKRWQKAKSVAAKEEAAKTLINCLGQIANRKP